MLATNYNFIDKLRDQILTNLCYLSLSGTDNVLFKMFDHEFIITSFLTLVMFDHVFAKE